MSITKEDIVRELMNQTKIDRTKAKWLIELLLKIVKETLGSGEDVMISGFGEFKIRQKTARVGRNPKTKVEYEIPARTVVTFHQSKSFQRKMNPAAD